jgi:predicted PurR-regulated permease PerM
MSVTSVSQPLDPEMAALTDAAPCPETVAIGIAPVGRAKTTPTQIILSALGAIAFLYFARPVVFPIFLAFVVATTLKPIIRWFSYCRITPALSGAIVLCFLVAVIAAGFFQLGQPALRWMNEAPAHITDLRQRIQTFFPRIARFNQAAAAVENLGATPERSKTPTVELKTSRVPNAVIDWTGTLLAGAGETLVLLYLLLASGDMFLQKLVHVMPTLGDKKRAVEISREIQQNLSNYLFTVTLINIGLGATVSVGLYYLGVPNGAMWGMLVAALNFVPYFGPVAGVVMLAVAGMLTFETLLLALLPPAWYLLLHLLEANLITPRLLGRRFTLNPVVIFISLIFWTWLWGAPGALLSVPILVAIKVICDRIPKLSSVSELLSN